MMETKAAGLASGRAELLWIDSNTKEGNWMYSIDAPKGHQAKNVPECKASRGNRNWCVGMLRVTCDLNLLGHFGWNRLPHLFYKLLDRREKAMTHVMRSSYSSKASRCLPSNMLCGVVHAVRQYLTYDSCHWRVLPYLESRQALRGNAYKRRNKLVIGWMM